MSSTTMQALVLTRYGGPDAAQLRDVPRPRPARGEVLVRVHAAGLNPVDYKTREGMLKVVQRYPLPIVMGNELAGVVEALGEGVTAFAPGNRVFARMPKEAMGGLAEYAVLPETFLAKMPASIDFCTAAGVPLAGLTAMQALRDELHVGQGSRVFIPGGAGGVGTFAIQLAKWLGAEVTTTASSRGRALVEELGADVVIDYTKGRFEEHLRDMDGVFDLIGGETLVKSFGVVKRGGKVVSVAGMPEPETARKDLGRGPFLRMLFWLASYRIRAVARKHGVSYRYLFMHPDGSELAELAGLIEAKAIRPVIDRVFPLKDVADAFAYLESGRAKGKVVVEIASGSVL
ncbi:Zinc-type alcohol dehydrogenase-like protein [Ensifer sp. M14]|uniref:NADP-dependent oxidoreductase n=1 Tax=Ensifer sp. M14 TaxID=2203782 RepID=UPI000E2A4212|nr:NADP-dependent oxidoreductase [Ensifer sp. M14]RDL51041.1 Zinc-type alcohol dehydrogenase-like protein [Ensifer sp. M14]